MIIEKYYFYETFVDLVECSISPNNHVTLAFQPSTCCVIVYVVLCQKCLESPGLNEAFLLECT